MDALTGQFFSSLPTHVHAPTTRGSIPAPELPIFQPYGLGVGESASIINPFPPPSAAMLPQVALLDRARSWREEVRESPQACMRP
jgi:hypothetical protein